MSNEKVIQAFLNKEKAHTPKRDITSGIYSYKGCTLTSTGDRLINYTTSIAWYEYENVVYVNMNKYSSTTSKIQSMLIRELKSKGIEYYEVR